jgi:hypothetical protein
MKRPLVLAAFLLALAPTGAAAQSWAQPVEAGWRRYGLLTVVCRSDGHTDMCLGLACRAGGVELVSAAGGGGPMDGRTRLRAGDLDLQLAFAWDDRAIDALGIAASRAAVTPGEVEALAATRTITLSSGGRGPGVSHRFPTRELAREWRRIAPGCRG